MNKKTIPLPSDVEYITAIDDLSFAKNVISQFKYMNFIYSLHIKHFIEMEIFIAMRHEVMFNLREKDFPTWKLDKLKLR